MGRYRLVAGLIAVVLPLTLQDVTTQLQLGEDAFATVEHEDFLLDAIGWVEKFTGHILQPRDVTEQFAGFGKMELRAWPILPTSVPAVAYADTTGTPIGVAGARVDVSRRPARVLTALGARWPMVPNTTLATVTIRAGYEDPDEVPRDLRRAMLVLIGGYDADREGGDIFAKAEASARRLCDFHRLRRL